MFHGAPIEWGPNPLEYGRVVAGWSAYQQTDPLMDFPQHHHPPATSPIEGRHPSASPASKHYKNQLLDAFHIRSAEAAAAEYFLTTDLKLVRLISHYKAHPPTCRVMAPAQLVRSLITNRELRLRDAIHFVFCLIRARRRPQSNHPSEQLLALGQQLEKSGYYDSKE